MKGYGVRKADQGCCPGHDKYPSETVRHAKTDRKRRPAKKHARQAQRRDVAAAIVEE